MITVNVPNRCTGVSDLIQLQDGTFVVVSHPDGIIYTMKTITSRPIRVGFDKIVYISQLNDGSFGLTTNDRKIGYKKDLSGTAIQFNTSGSVGWQVIQDRVTNTYILQGWDQKIYTSTNILSGFDNKNVNTNTKMKYISQANDNTFLLIGTDDEVYRLSSLKDNGVKINGLKWFRTIRQLKDNTYVLVGGDFKIYTTTSLNIRPGDPIIVI
jgi:hypothetical protein